MEPDYTMPKENIVIPKEATKSITECCAFSQINADNTTPKHSIEKILWRAKKQRRFEWYGEDHGAGERAFFCIVCPHENILEQNLVELGFKIIMKFDRRNGYPNTGQLKMFAINF